MRNNRHSSHNENTDLEVRMVLTGETGKMKTKALFIISLGAETRALLFTIMFILSGTMPDT